MCAHMYVCTIYMCMYIVSYIHVYVYNELPRWLSDKESTCQAGDKGSLPRNEGSILAWDIPWTEEPGRLQSMGSPISFLPDPFPFGQPPISSLYLLVLPYFVKFLLLYCCLESTWKWNHMVFIFLWLISLTIIPLRSICVVRNSKISFFFMVNIPLTTSSLSIHLSIDTQVTSVSWLL